MPESAFDIATLIQVILADLVLAGDNAVAVGLAAASLPEAQRRRAIFWGIVLALVLRIVFALLATQLMAVKGLLLVGGLLLFWIAWRMWKDLSEHAVAEEVLANTEPSTRAAAAPPSFFKAFQLIVLADVSMSLDNVLVVAGVARHAPAIMAFGLILSVVAMGAAATLIAGVINRYRWIAYLGLAVIVFAAFRMVWEDLAAFQIAPPLPGWMAPPHPPA
jgi:YjbE family integral membrane protein